jgi:hypothetical protein
MGADQMLTVDQNAKSADVYVKISTCGFYGFSCSIIIEKF